MLLEEIAQPRCFDSARARRRVTAMRAERNIESDGAGSSSNAVATAVQLEGPARPRIEELARRPATTGQFILRPSPALLVLATLGVLCACGSPPAARSTARTKVLRMAPQSDLEILDPVWTTAAITRDHGYMIYDTLFGLDAEGHVAPQMVDRYDVSKDRRVWTFVLRSGVEFHDGRPVTSDDVIASLQRWGKRDILGQRLVGFVDSWEALNAKTFRIKLTEPYELVLESLAKPDGTVPFIMPKRVAETAPDRQIADYTGSGPFIFNKAEWKPGERVVYTRNAKYVPRLEPASGTAGGKLAKVDRVEWVIIRDPQTQANALIAGEIDLVEQPAFELYPQLKSHAGVRLVETNPLGAQFVLRFNHLQPPFDDVRVRRAAMAALNQPAFLQTQIGNRDVYRSCFSIYPCRTAYASPNGMDFIAAPDLERARQLLQQSGYTGTPVVVLRPTDQAILSKLPVVATELLRQAGFTVEMQSMDWQTLVSRRAKTNGWSVFITSAGAALVMNPLSNSALSAACGRAWFGWPCDGQLEALRDRFARAGSEPDRKAIADQIQVRAMEIGTHVPLGEYVQAVAARSTISGLLAGYFTVLWSVDKQ
jgi:peptide/nickel transport system substrate-binding protein